MAYPTVSAPYGFVPLNRFDGIAYAGATQLYPVTAATAVYNGDVVKFVNGGTVEPIADLHNTGIFAVGVCVGGVCVCCIGTVPLTLGCAFKILDLKSCGNGPYFASLSAITFSRSAALAVGPANASLFCSSLS